MKHVLLGLIVVILAAALCSCAGREEAPPEDEAAGEAILDENPEATPEDGTAGAAAPYAGLEAPPQLKLLLNEDGAVMTLVPTTFQWRHDNGDGTGVGTFSDAAHPLDVLDQLPALEAVQCDGTVDIVLEEGMEVTSVSWWDMSAPEYTAAREAAGEVVDGEQTVLRLQVEPGRVYEIHVGYGAPGDSFYSFTVK